MKIDISSPQSIAQAAASVLKTHPFLIVATVDEASRPWAVPVHQITLPDGRLTWRSAVSARHSLNIAASAKVSGVLFSTSLENGEVSLFLEGTASSLESDSDVEIALDARYSTSPEKRPELAELMGQSEYRIYAFNISAAWVNDDSHTKNEVDVPSLLAALKQS